MPVHRISTRPPNTPVEPPRLDSDPTTIVAHLEDAAHYPGGSSASIAFPASEGEVAWLLRTYAAVLPIGAQSSLTGGATPRGDVVLNTSRLNAVTVVSRDRVRVQAGVPVLTLQQALDVEGLYYPPVPTYTGAFAGGVVATNAAGAATFKYGATRPWVQGLTVVLASGEVLDITRGSVTASPAGTFEIVTSTGLVTVPIPRLTMPEVPKRSAGYHCAPGMDLIDLFIGSEGTLGVIVDATFRVIPKPAARWLVLVPVGSESLALALVGRLRDASRETWASAATGGLDVSAIEHMDRPSLDYIRADGVDGKLNIPIPDDTEVVLLVEVEDTQARTREEAWELVSDAMTNPDHVATSPIEHLVAILAEFDVLESAEIAWPDDTKRRQQFLDFREAVPAAVNGRVALAKRTASPNISKIAADVVVPYDRLGELLSASRHIFERDGLAYAIWGHISDGNVHPNVVARSEGEVATGRAAILEIAKAAIALGGCPLAEHGVGRNPLKQQMVELLYGREGIRGMRAIKHALDPRGVLARDVIFAFEESRA